jgi:hypothetical protein
MPALSDVDLCARAMLLIGAQPIQSFEDGTVEASVAAGFYAVVREGLLGCHPWNFAIRIEDLARLVEAPGSDYAYAFQLPQDVVRILSIGRAGWDRGIPYRRVGQTVETDAEAVTLRYVGIPEETSFPAYFQLALIMALAEAFVLPLTESTTRWVEMGKAAERQLSRARLIDAQEDTPEQMATDILTMVR